MTLTREQIAGLRDSLRRQQYNTIAVQRDDLSALLDELDALRALRARDERDAMRWRLVRAADADNDEPYVAVQRRDSWGKNKAEWLMHNDADAAIDRLLAVDAGEVGNG